MSMGSVSRRHTKDIPTRVAMMTSLGIPTEKRRSSFDPPHEDFAPVGVDVARATVTCGFWRSEHGARHSNV